MPSASGRSDRPEVTHLLQQAASLFAGHETSIRLETDVLETVYVEMRGPDPVVHDWGATAYYLISGGDTTYGPWSHPVAVAECSRLGVALRDDGDADSTRYVIECTVPEGGSVADTVERVSKAIDAVFHRHLRDDLRS